MQSYLPYLKDQQKGMLARWYLRLARFLPTFRLEHKPGSANVVADTLSRAPVRDDTPDGSEAVLTVLDQDAYDSTLKLVRDEQSKDEQLMYVIDYLRSNKLPEDAMLAKQILEQAKKGYVVVDNVLYYEGTDVPGRRRLVVPKHLQQKLVDDHHDRLFTGHFASKRTIRRLSQYFYWRGMSSDVYHKCSSCIQCASIQGQGHRGSPHLRVLKLVAHLNVWVWTF